MQEQLHLSCDIHKASQGELASEAPSIIEKWSLGFCELWLVSSEQAQLLSRSWPGDSLLFRAVGSPLGSLRVWLGSESAGQPFPLSVSWSIPLP